jgi:hypothetical protein
MNDQGDLTPPLPPDPPQDPSQLAVPAPAPAPTSWWSRYRRFLIPAAGVAVVVAAATGALALVLKPAPTVEKMVPSTENVLLVANIDPSASQKLNLMRALHRFPDLTTDKAITEKLDQALKDSGLSFSGDIQPWLGAEIGVSAQVSLQQSKDIPAVVYLVSRDDAKAQAMLAKVRSGKLGKALTWTESSYKGITISIGTPKGSGNAEAYAYVDHVAVIASSSSTIQQIIDTDQGRATRLVDATNFKATMGSLPSDRVAFLYVDGKSLVASIQKELRSMPAATGSIKNLGDLEAFQGIGGTLSANGNGVLADLVIKLDSSRLSPSSRAALARAGRPDAVLRWVPRGSDAFVAVGSLDQTIKTLLDQAGSDPTVTQTTDAIGLTGPGGVLPHLSGGAGLELEVGARVIPAGAVLIGTNDAASMNSFFKKLILTATQVANQSSLLTPGSTTPAQPFKTTTYRGVLITSFAGPLSGTAAAAFQPSYAVSDGMGILASNLAEVKAVIDAHTGSSTIAAEPTYQTALGGSLKQPSAIVYVNVSSLVEALRRFSAESGLSSVDTKTIAELAPVKALILTASSQADAMIERLFVVIQ